MQRHLMKSKIHRATITSADLHYEGSLTIDQELLDAADLATYEEVQVVNVNNGARFSTYVIPGPRGSGVLQLNGAAARQGLPGDLVIVISYGVYTGDEAGRHSPAVVFVDSKNRIIRPQLRAES
jgi:aspartate 1-decarboxylase